MKWYQHDSNCHNDEKIRRLIHEEGLEAYAIYHICLELIAEKIDESKRHWIEISERVLCEKLCMRLARVQRKLNSSSFQTLLQTHNEKGMFILSCPNLLKRLDNWTKRSVVTTKKVPLQIESNKKENNNTYSKEFEKFWSVYPRREGKGLASSIFGRLPLGDGLLDKIISAVEIQKKSDQWTKNGGQYIPMPATWLNQRRWEDEGIQVQSKKKVGPRFVGISEEMYGKV